MIKELKEESRNVTIESFERDLEELNKVVHQRQVGPFQIKIPIPNLKQDSSLVEDRATVEIKLHDVPLSCQVTSFSNPF